LLLNYLELIAPKAAPVSRYRTAIHPENFNATSNSHNNKKEPSQFDKKKGKIGEGDEM
jgi:hypothetical protein